MMCSIGVDVIGFVSQYLRIVIVGILEGSENDVLFLVNQHSRWGQPRSFHRVYHVGRRING